MKRWMQCAVAVALLAFNMAVWAGAPQVDGVIDPEEWADAQPMPLPYEIDPGVNTAARQATEARYKVEAGSLFVAFIAQEAAPGSVRSRRRERDSIDDEDSVGVVIAPAGVGGSEAYFFYVSAGGTQFDSRWDEANGEEDQRWDARWVSTVGTREGGGYIVEMRIPLSILSLPSGQTQSWGVNFIRVRPRDHRYRFASIPKDRNRSCYVCQLKPIELKMDQYIDWLGFEARVDVAYQNDRYRHSSEVSTSEVRHNLGVDITWRPRYNMSATLTLNPDFSQVEADVLRPVTNAADTYFYDERRPFFVEAEQSLSLILPLFYSRNIVDPDVAVDVRYRGEKGSATLVYAEDAITQLVQPGVEGSRVIEYHRPDGSNMPGRALALRAQRALGMGTVGAAVIARQGDAAYQNEVVAVDTRMPLGGSATVNALVALSETSAPDGGGAEGMGWAGYVQVKRETLNWNGSLAYDRYDDDFRADMGRLVRAGVHRLQGELERTFRFPDAGAISEASVQLDGIQRYEIGGNLVDRRSQLSFSLAGIGQTRATLWLIDGSGRYRQRYWSRDGWEFALDTAPFSAWTGSLGVLWVDDVDRLGVRPAELRQGHAELSWSPSDTMRWQYDGTFKRLEISEGRLLDERIHDLRGYYYFSNNFYLRGILRHWSIDRGVRHYPGLTLSKRESSLDWQLLLAWRPTVGTSLYAGYSKGRDVDEAPTFDSIESTQNTWFIKASISFDRDGIFR